MNVAELTGSSTKMSARGSDRVDQPSCEKIGGKAPQGHPDYPEEDRLRQLQIGGERLAKPDDDEQRRDDKQHKSNVEHRRRSLPDPGMPGGSYAALLGASYRAPGCRDTDTGRPG